MILLNEDTKCLVQGITGKQGSFHTEQMLKYNTNIAAGITPKRRPRLFRECRFSIQLKRLWKRSKSILPLFLSLQNLQKMRLSKQSDIWIWLSSSQSIFQFMTA